MSDTLFAILFGLASALEVQGQRVEELERRVNELEKLLQPPPVWTPDFVRFETNASFRPEEIFRVPPPAPLGVTIYERGRPPRLCLFESERGRIVSATVGVDEGREGGDRTAVFFVRREASPDAPDFVTRSRVVSIEKETPRRAEDEPEEA